MIMIQPGANQMILQLGLGGAGHSSSIGRSRRLLGCVDSMGPFAPQMQGEFSNVLRQLATAG